MKFVTKDSFRLVVLFVVAAIIFTLWGAFVEQDAWQQFGAAGVLVALCLLTVFINWVKYGRKA